MKKVIILLTVLLLAFSFAACKGKPVTNVVTETEINDADEIDAGGPSAGWYGDLPGGFTPVIMVNGKLYTWTGMSKEYIYIEADDGYTDVVIVGDTSTVLPNGYSEAGEILSITAETPTENLQLMAGFEASGTVYTSEVTPEAVYVLMTTDWFENYYIRFVSDDLRDGECISYNGSQYRISIGTGISETVEELPDGYVLVGTLKYMGDDYVPSADLETNCVSDSYGHYLDGREVYADPNNNSVIYVYEHHYWAQGDYPAYLACKLWGE